MRGFGLPGCGRGVSVPTSTKPKPRSSSASGTSAFLSKPAAMPRGLGKSRSHSRTRKPRIVRLLPAGSGQAGRERADRKAVRPLGVETEHEGPCEVVEPADHSFTARACSPDSSIGSTDVAADTGSGP